MQLVNLKYLLAGPLQKQFADPWFIVMLKFLSQVVINSSHVMSVDFFLQCITLYFILTEIH